MINTVIVCDKDDKELGDFFSLCKYHAIKTSQQHKVTIKELHSEDIDVVNFSNHLLDINQANFLFFSFVHGSCTSMTINGHDHFLSTSNNYYTLSNAFIYAFSCYNGMDLADKLLENKAHVYWGYLNKAWVCYDFIDEFEVCALSGFDFFALGNTIENAESMMIARINEEIDEISGINMFAASLLMKNRDAMIIKGDKQMTINDFII